MQMGVDGIDGVGSQKGSQSMYVPCLPTSCRISAFAANGTMY